jgi:hypothetical protein
MRRAAIALAATALSVAWARAEQAEPPHVPVKELHVAFQPADSCDGACAATADAERAKLGPSPTWPRYRASPTESKAARDQQMRQNRKNSEALVLTREQAMDIWTTSYPKDPTIPTISLTSSPNTGSFPGSAPASIRTW